MSTGCSPPGRAPPPPSDRATLIKLPGPGPWPGPGAETGTVAVAASAVGEVDLHDRDIPAQGG
jgi:hypothetical protein